MLKRILLPLLTMVGATTALIAHPVPELVKDINTRPADDGAKIQFPTAMGDTLFFSACDAAHGQELWKSDGTPGGTKLLKDVLPGFGSSFPRELTVVGNTLYFVADDFQHGFQLWKSDGTPDGTGLVKDLAGDTSKLAPKSLIAAGNKLFFLLPTENGPDRLWVSDGTEGGTVEVLPEDPPQPSPHSYRASPHSLVSLKDTVVFIRGNSLYCSDGTAVGTVSLGEITDEFTLPGGRWWRGGGLPFIVFQDTIVFRRGGSLYRSDGSPGGTVSLGSITPSFGDVHCFVGDDILYFATGQWWAGQWWGERDLWRSDGSPDSTVFISSLGGAFEEGVVLGDTLVFSMWNGDVGSELWCSDGTSAGTRLLKDIAVGTDGDGYPKDSNPGNFTVMGDFVYFTARQPKGGRKLWRTDGSEAGTTVVLNRKDRPAADGTWGTWASWELLAMGKKLWFSNSAIDIWVTDGSSKGSHLLKREIGFSSNYDMARFTPVGNMQFFVSSEQLWRTDGTKRGTIQLTGLRDRTASSGLSNFGSNPQNDPAVKSAFFEAFDGARVGVWTSRGAGPATYPVRYFNDWSSWGLYPIWKFYPMGDRALFVNNWENHLWVSNGTSKGTRRLFNGRGSDWNLSEFGLDVIGAIDNETYFTNAWGEFTGEIWKTDGTVRGTKKVREPSQVPLASTAQPATERTLFFFREGTLYRTDGTSGNTWAVNDSGNFKGPLVRLENQIYFLSTEMDGTSGLWCSDGTPAGTTRRLFDGLHEVANPVVFKDKVFVFMGSGLWSTDGTEQGTQLVVDGIVLDTSHVVSPIVAGNFLYFPAYDDANRLRLWRSDGSADGTSMVGTLNLHASNFSMGEPVVVGSIVYFAASTEMEGQELWRTDGTDAGTYMVADLTGDSGSSEPGGFRLLGSQLLFWATTSARGRELYSLDVSADLAPPP